ncbi:MAG: hypothetical protein A2516_09250 [Alphaproteobacteria bacterium RIFOXYD12_FULL_60_8]|nr:MAG: hypothetical protein A2516_09250 [Alphaproteobacteria bacterium RIFOXYD12_FULL_60_8]
MVWVAVSETAALEDWKARVARHGVLMVGALAVIVVLSLLALRGIRRERLAAANLEMLNKRLYSTNLELERYAEVAAHHLQEPLRIINSYAQLLESRFSPKLQGECKEFLDFLVQGSREMKELLSDLQFYTALDPIGTPVTTSADAGHCAREALKDLKNTPQIETVSLGKLPTVKAVPRQLTILFQLLIHNALTYTSPDRVPVVTVSAEPDEAGWRFTVRDNGIGVEPAYRERIFRMFERLHPRGKYPGTGIGLAICRKIVERHGGRIWCDSNPGEGSAFSFTLPAAPVPTP